MASVDWLDLQRLSRAAADLGHYNVAKLLQAAIASSLNRQLYGETLPKSDAEFLSAFDRAIEGLRESGLDPDLLVAFDQSQPDRPALERDRMVPVEAGGDLLVERRVGQ